MSGDAVLVFVTRALTIFRQCFQDLVDEGDIVLIDVEAEKTQFVRRRSANAVKEHECLGDQIVAVFIGLSGHYTLMFHLHFVGVILFYFIMRVMKFVVASRGHFGGVDRHGGPDFSLRHFHFVVKHLEKDGARIGRLQLCVQTPSWMTGLPPFNRAIPNELLP